MGRPDVNLKIVSQQQPLAVISKDFKISLFQKFWFEIRQSPYLSIIPAESPQSVRLISRAFREKKAVVFVMDQFMGPGKGVPVRFFKFLTGAPKGLALLWQRYPLPVVPVVAYDDPDGVIHVVVEPPLDVPPRLGLESLTQFFMDHVERIICQYHSPSWMWLHRRFKRWYEISN